ncbi:hypothetical protein [uncultured Mucilaginibacter sp.]|uniref:hypothetical protein n=1 Tax=uncultured Mucilaginibacter sp. TaxID=797541 RepID=UPI0025DAD1D0|nr:hypothetical protein [uncultured Mucilaginibacter sp.]
MRRILFITLCCVFCAVTLQAQTMLNGRVFEYKTRIALQGVSIENLGNKIKAITGPDGGFRIAAKTGDLLVLKSFGYQTDTLLLTDLHDKELFLEPQRMELKQVTVTDSNAKASQAAKNMQYVDPQFHGQTMVYHRDLKKQFDGGIILRMHYFKGYENKKNKALEKEQQRMLSEEISTIFTADNISHYLPLKGTDLDNFLLLYTPDIKVYNSKDFNLLEYLNTSYKTWLTLTPDQCKAGQIFNKR